MKLLLNVKVGSKVKSRPLRNRGSNVVGHQEYRPACDSEDDEIPRKQDNKQHNSQRGRAVGCDFTVSASTVQLVARVSWSWPSPAPREASRARESPIQTHCTTYAYLARTTQKAIFLNSIISTRRVAYLARVLDLELVHQEGKNTHRTNPTQIENSSPKRLSEPKASSFIPSEETGNQEMSIAPAPALRHAQLGTQKFAKGAGKLLPARPHPYRAQSHRSAVWLYPRWGNVNFRNSFLSI